MLIMSILVSNLERSHMIPFMEGYFEDQGVHDPKKMWEVIDHATKEVVPVEKWTVMKKQRYGEGTFVLSMSIQCHFSDSPYAWDPTQMYNHITSLWAMFLTIFH